MEERRKYPRFKKPVGVKIHRPANEDEIGVIDISLGGIAIYGSLKYCHLEDVVYVELKLSKGDSIVCNARIAWMYPLCPSL